MATGKRKLVSVRRIAEITPIKKADRIELALIDGWNCVVRKGEFAVGDHVLYFEIDAFLPITDPRFDAFTKKNPIPAVNPANGIAGAPIRTLVLQKTISQGLALPMSLFPEIAPDTPLGTDVSAAIGVTKWNRPLPKELLDSARGYLPTHITRTEQVRIQNEPEHLEDEHEYEVSIKLDGESMTVYNFEGVIGVGSHEVDFLDKDDNVFWNTARKQNLVKAISHLPGFAIQGELFGEGIKGNPEGIVGQDFRIFDVLDLERSKYLTPDERMEFVEKLWNFGAQPLHVPVMEKRIVPKRDIPTMRDALAFAAGKGVFGGKKREGVVFKRVDGAVTFKIVDNGYLLDNPED